MTTKKQRTQERPEDSPPGNAANREKQSVPCICKTCEIITGKSSLTFNMFYSEHKAVSLESKTNKTLGHIFEGKWVEKMSLLFF